MTRKGAMPPATIRRQWSHRIELPAEAVQGEQRTDIGTRRNARRGALPLPIFTMTGTSPCFISRPLRLPRRSVSASVASCFPSTSRDGDDNVRPRSTAVVEIGMDNEAGDKPLWSKLVVWIAYVPLTLLLVAFLATEMAGEWMRIGWWHLRRVAGKKQIETRSSRRESARRCFSTAS